MFCFVVSSFPVFWIVISTLRSGMVSLRCIGRCKIFQLGQEKKTKVRASQPLHCILFLLLSRTLPSYDVAPHCAALNCTASLVLQRRCQKLLTYPPG